MSINLLPTFCKFYVNLIYYINHVIINIITRVINNSTMLSKTMEVLAMPRKNNRFSNPVRTRYYDRPFAGLEQRLKDEYQYNHKSDFRRSTNKKTH